MNILGLNFQSQEGLTRHNVRRAIELVRFCATGHPIDLVVLPELFTCGYCGMDLTPYAEAQDGPTAQAFRELAAELNVVVGYGFPEVAKAGKVYNSYAIIDGEKLVHVYRKTHLHISEPGTIPNEPEYMEPGDYLGLADTRLGRLGIMICYDGFFPEVCRSLVLSGATVVLWPSHCDGYLAGTGLPAVRAFENLVPIAHVEGSQTDGTGATSAHSLIVGHTGDVRGEFVGGDGVVYADVDPDAAVQARREWIDVWGLYRVRRPELYELGPGIP